MSLPEPHPGLVIRYSYLWADENDRGREEGTKDRPCAVLLAIRTNEGDVRVTVLPITHSPPVDLSHAIEVPLQTKKRLGLDDDQSWIILTEVNIFNWPGPDLRFKRGAGPESVAYGMLPSKLIKTMRDRFLDLHRLKKSRSIRRTE